jgi:matrixin
VTHRAETAYFLVLLSLVEIVLSLQAPAARAFSITSQLHLQDSFTYCFTSNVNSAQRSRYRDGLQAWRQRQIVSWTEHSCSDSGALTVDLTSVDGHPGGTAAVTVNNGFTMNPERTNFDSAENWYTGTGPSLCNTIDFWGIAAHEIGHVWGLGEALEEGGDDFSPQGEPITMGLFTLYNCDPLEALRTLSSDDEAGIHYVHYFGSAGFDDYMPNFSFERTQDCIDPLGCVSDFYWTLSPDASRYSRICGDGNAYVHNCYESLTAGGTFIQRVRRRLCNGSAGCAGQLVVRVNNRGAAAANVRLQVLDVTSGSNVLSDTTTLIAPGGWRVAASNFVPASGAQQRLYEYRIVKGASTSGTSMWFDDFVVHDLP